MRQIWIPKTGGPEVLEVREAPDPDPGAGEVRVRVKASGINFADILARMGLYPDAPPLPLVVGYEVAGEIDALGAGVDDLKEGDRVVAMCQFGGYSDVVTAPRAQIQPLSEKLTFEQGAAIPVNYITAWLMLIRLGNLQPGERVLIHGAAGGVGQAATQICLWREAVILGTASPGKHDRLRELGVDHCIDYTSQDFEEEVMRITDGKGVGIALDPIGGKSFAKSYRCLGPLGRMFMFGVASFATGKKFSIISALRGLVAMPKFKAIPLMNENRGVFGANLGHLWDQAEELGAMLASIRGLIDEGHLLPVVDKTFSFEQAGDAHAYIQDRKNFGKVILTP